jgi:hypothetical protein
MIDRVIELCWLSVTCLSRYVKYALNAIKFTFKCVPIGDIALDKLYAVQPFA